MTNKIKALALKVFALLTLMLFLSVRSFADNTPALISIVIDDLGYNLSQGSQAIALPGALSFAILPHTPNAITLAELAHQNGKEVILHAPMENHSARPLGPGGLISSLDKQTLIATLLHDLNSVPHIRGLNNHMGSRLTEMQQPMGWIMEQLHARNLFFIDSKTSAESIAEQTAHQYRVPAMARDIFLDHEQTTEFLHQQFKKLITIAKQRGHALAIGHPYPVTIEYLRMAIPRLNKQEVILVPASQVLLVSEEKRITNKIRTAAFF